MRESNLLREVESATDRYPESYRDPSSPQQKKSTSIIGVSQEWISKSLVHKQTFQSQDEAKGADSEYRKLVRKESSIH